MSIAKASRFVSSGSLHSFRKCGFVADSGDIPVPCTAWSAEYQPWCYGVASTPEPGRTRADQRLSGETPNPPYSHPACGHADCQHETGFYRLELPEVVFSIMVDFEAVDALFA